MAYLPLGCAFLALAVTGCGGCGDSSRAGPGSGVDGSAGDSGLVADAAPDTSLDAPQPDAAEPDAADPDAGLPARPAFFIELALNDATSAQAPRGWPLLILGVAVLFSEVTQPIALDAASLRLRLTDASGQELSWPLVQLTTLEPNLALDSNRARAEVTWALSPAQTGALPLGSYRAELAWAGQTSPALAIEIVDPPAAAQVRRASLEARYALLRNDPAAALASLSPALAAQPNDVALRTWEALVHEAAGSTDNALSSAEVAVEQVFAGDGGPTEPSSTLDLRNRLLRRSLGLEGGAP